MFPCTDYTVVTVFASFLHYFCSILWIYVLNFEICLTVISIAGHAPTVKLCALRIAPVCFYQCSLNKKSDSKICSTDFKANVPVNFEFVYTYSYLKYRNVH